MVHFEKNITTVPAQDGLDEMTSTLPDDAAKAIESLRRQFVQRMAHDLRTLTPSAGQLEAALIPGADISTLRKICHGLMGSAGLFGFDAVADAAASAQAVLKSGQCDDRKIGVVIRDLAAEIQKALGVQQL
jgi:HPt (histidine-containing phosphotransfer) domain-containing protein